MPDGQIFLLGCLVTLLCVAFFVVSAYELRRLGKQADRKHDDYTPFN